jgi:hypothetical protein
MVKCKFRVARRSGVQLRSWEKKFRYDESVVTVRETASYVGSLADNRCNGLDSLSYLSQVQGRVVVSPE